MAAALKPQRNPASQLSLEQREKLTCDLSVREAERVDELCKRINELCDERERRAKTQSR